MAILMNIVISFVLSLIVGFIVNVTKLNIFGIFATLYTLVLLVPGLAQSVGRMHDVNKSSWYLLLDIIPVIGWILVL